MMIDRVMYQRLCVLIENVKVGNFWTFKRGLSRHNVSDIILRLPQFCSNIWPVKKADTAC